MRKSIVLVLFLALGYSAVAQNSDFDPNVNHYNTSVRIINDAANGFSVEYHNWYKIVTNHIVNETYALVCCGQPTTNFTGYHAVLNTPVNNVGVTTIRDFLPYMELLDLSSAVKSIEAYQNVTSPCYGNVTDTPGNNTVDVIFTDHANTDLPGPPYVAFSPDSDQLTPLQKASWLVYVALFFDQEASATTIFSNIESTYNCHKSNLAELSDKQNVAWTYYESSTNTWSLLRDSFYATLVADAGAILVEPNSAQSANYTHLNEFHTAIRYADYVIDMSPLAKLGNQSYQDWLQLGGFTGSTDVYNEAFIAQKNIFRTDGLVNANGYSDWPQRSPARPDLALRDIIHMIEPTYEANYSFTWLRNFAKADIPRQISDIQYLCNAKDIFDEAQCYPHVFGVNSTGTSDDSGDNSSHALSAGGKAGISVGVIVFVGAAAVAGFFLFRKYRQGKVKRPFYRMNDIQ